MLVILGGLLVMSVSCGLIVKAAHLGLI